MSVVADLVLLAILVTDLHILSTIKLRDVIRTSAVQGLLLAVLPLALHGVPGSAGGWLHVAGTSAGTALLKAGVIPWLLFRAVRLANPKREVEPFISLHASVLAGAALIGFAFWMAEKLPMPVPVATSLLVPVAVSNVLLGFLLLVSRKKAITQVVGYLMLENGVFLFGLCLARSLPFVVELAVLLDVLVGVFIMGIAIHHISREFDHIDTDALASLKD